MKLLNFEETYKAYTELLSKIFDIYKSNDNVKAAKSKKKKTVKE